MEKNFCDDHCIKAELEEEISRLKTELRKERKTTLDFLREDGRISAQVYQQEIEKSERLPK